MDERLRPDTIIKFDDVIPISARNKDNTDKLKHRLRELLDLYADIEFDKQHSKDIVLKGEKLDSQLREHFEGERSI